MTDFWINMISRASVQLRAETCRRNTIDLVPVGTTSLSPTDLHESTAPITHGRGTQKNHVELEFTRNGVKCPHCNNCFGTVDILAQHLSAVIVARPEADRVCIFCDFIDRSNPTIRYSAKVVNWMRHLKRHLVEIPCDRIKDGSPCTFITNSDESMKRYIDKHHPAPESVKTIWQCDICKDVYQSRQTLVRHQEVHQVSR
jgi:hypothetical protein